MDDEEIRFKVMMLCPRSTAYLDKINEIDTPERDMQEKQKLVNLYVNAAFGHQVSHLLDQGQLTEGAVHSLRSALIQMAQARLGSASLVLVIEIGQPPRPGSNGPDYGTHSNNN